jgi:hypothetical protein
MTLTLSGSVTLTSSSLTRWSTTDAILVTVSGFADLAAFSAMRLLEAALPFFS